MMLVLVSVTMSLHVGVLLQMERLLVLNSTVQGLI